MTSTPDSISPDALQELMDSATSEEEAQENRVEYTWGTLTPDEITEGVKDLITRCHDELNVNHPIIAKVILHTMIMKLMSWHSHSSVDEMSKGEDHYNSAMCWARDAGKFQALANILHTISVSDDDFTYVDPD